jgi:hypothetical protein
MAMTSTMDRVLSAQAIELLERLESLLPPGFGAMFQIYNTAGLDLQLIVATLGSGDPGDALRVLEVVRERFRSERAQDAGRRYVAPMGGSPDQHVISSARVITVGGHEVVQLWSRGGLAGELVVSHGDGARMCCTMLMLEPADE